MVNRWWHTLQGLWLCAYRQWGRWGDPRLGATRLESADEF